MLFNGFYINDNRFSAILIISYVANSFHGGIKLSVSVSIQKIPSQRTIALPGFHCEKASRIVEQQFLIVFHGPTGAAELLFVELRHAINSVIGQ
jgi:hypothetical protein